MATQPLTRALPTTGTTSIRIAARLVGVDEGTLRRRAVAGKCPGKMIDGRWRFPWQWIRAMRESAARP